MTEQSSVPPPPSVEQLQPIQKKELLKVVQKRSSLEMMARLAQGNFDPESPFNPEAPIDLSKSVENASLKLTEQVDKERKFVWDEFDKHQSENDTDFVTKDEWNKMTDKQKQEIRMQVYVESQIEVVWPQLKDNPNAIYSLWVLGTDVLDQPSEHQEEEFKRFLRASPNGIDNTLYDRFFTKGKNSAYEILQVFAQNAKGGEDILDSKEFIRNVDAIKPLIVGLFGREQAFSAFSAVADLNSVIVSYPNVFTPDFLKRCPAEEIGLGRAGMPQDTETKSLDYLAGKFPPREIDFGTKPESSVLQQPVSVSTELPDETESASATDFALTDEWQEVTDNYSSQIGDTIRIDPKTGKRYFKRPIRTEEDKRQNQEDQSSPEEVKITDDWQEVPDDHVLKEDEEEALFAGKKYIRKPPSSIDTASQDSLETQEMRTKNRQTKALKNWLSKAVRVLKQEDVIITNPNYERDRAIAQKFARGVLLAMYLTLPPSFAADFFHSNSAGLLTFALEATPVVLLWPPVINEMMEKRRNRRRT